MIRTEDFEQVAVVSAAECGVEQAENHSVTDYGTLNILLATVLGSSVNI